MNNPEIKIRILKDIETARAAGITLISEDYGSVHNKCMCALGCVVFSPTKSASLSQLEEHIQEIFDVSYDWVISFTDGFDANGTAKGASVPEAWKLGKEIAKETAPMTYTEFLNSLDI